MTSPHRVLVMAKTDGLASTVLNSFRERASELSVSTVTGLTALRSALADGVFTAVVTGLDEDGSGAHDVVQAARERSAAVPVVVVGAPSDSEIAAYLTREGAHACVPADDYGALADAIEGAALAKGPAPQQEPSPETPAGEERDRLALLEEVIDLAGVWLCATDVQGKVLVWNRAAEEITGYSRAEVLGSAQVFGWLCSESGQRRSIREAGDQVLHQVERLHGEITIRCKRGQKRTVSWSARRMCDRHGQPSGVLVVGADVTEQRLVQRRTRQTDTMEAVSRLAGGIAHDLNDLLTEIMGHCDLASRDYQAEERLCQRVHLIRTAARRGAPLAKRLLSLSRDPARHNRVVDVNQMVRAAAGRLVEMAGHSIEVELHLSPAPEPVEMDPVQLEEVLLNLAGNACDAMPAGGRLVISTDNVRLEGSYAGYMALRPGHYVLLAVSDTGMGIYEDLHPLIFEPFFTTKPDRQGLGLSTVYAVASRCGGTVQVSSEVGSGCVFKVYLPRLEGAKLPAAEEAGKQPAEELSATILLVEDRTELRELMQVVLEREGYRVLAAGNARDALALSADPDQPIDLLIADVVVPGMHGDCLAAELKTRRPGLRVLLTSGLVSEEDVAEAIAANGDDFMRKPFSARDLVLKTREMLGHGRPGQH